MKTTVTEQKRKHFVHKLNDRIATIYANMAIGKMKDYWSGINDIRDFIDDLCVCEIYENECIYAFVCASWEHYNVNEYHADGSLIRPDKSLSHLQAAVWNLSDEGWPAPGHIQFWDWVGELRRRHKEYLHPTTASPNNLRLNSWEWVIENDWDKFQPGFDQGQISDDTGTEQFVIGYFGDEYIPYRLFRKDGVWIAGGFGNAGWRETEIISSNWRSPQAAEWNLIREPQYPGYGWYNGPGTEEAPDNYDDYYDDEAEFGENGMAILTQIL